MKKLNEKGFAISAVLYTMLILMILLMFLILAILDNGRTTANKLSSEVKEEIDNKVYNKPIEVVSNSLYEKVVNEGKANIGKTVTLNKTSAEANENGVYSVNSGFNKIYFYRGNVTNNNVLFANLCWKIVRTTDTGGVKLIYSGTPTNGTCNASGDNLIIGKSTYNSSHKYPSYVGYTHNGNNKIWSSGSIIDKSYYYGSSVIYDESTKKYVLQDKVKVDLTPDKSLVGNRHYTCFSTEYTCSSVYYLFGTSNWTSIYTELKNGQLTLDDALWSNDTVSSNIKTTIDNWYVNTAKLQNYSSFLEDTIWCNDRNIIDGILLSNSAVSDDSIQVSTYNSWRNVSNGQPSFSCLNARDSYNVAGGLGNGRLEYPVGLLTADEIMYAGGTTNGANNTYYLYTANNDIATMTPSKSTGGRYLNTYSHWSSANIAYIDVNGRISGGGIYEVKKDDFRQDDPRSETTVGKVTHIYGIRPVIALKNTALVKGGDGKASSPYIVG